MQKKLLDDEQLQEAAIAVDVEDGTVTLSGVVNTNEEAGRALKVSEQIAGVSRIASRMLVNNPQTSSDHGD